METPYDAELAILGELERILRSRVTASRDHAAGRRAPQRSSGDRRRGSRRIPAAATAARRVAVLTALALLLGATAVATRALVNTDRDPTLRTSQAVQIGHGVVGQDAWRLTVYRRHDQVCHDLLAAGTLASSCDAPPSARGVVIDGTLTPTHRFVLGLTGPDVAAVEVRDGDNRHRAVTHEAPTGTLDQRGAVPQGLRSFVIVLRRPADQRASTVSVVPLDGHGRALSGAETVCSVAPPTATCP